MFLLFSLVYRFLSQTMHLILVDACLFFGSVEILNLMQIISTTFLSMLYTMSLSLISFT